MNKKIKNIASVVQTKSAAVLCTLCAVLFLASCAEDEMADGTHSQKQDLRTVSVNFDMPADKPSFGDGTASRAALDAQPAEILLGDSTLAVSRAEGGSQSRSESTSSAWENDDQILVKIDAGSTQGRLTLQYIDPAAIPAPASGEEPQTATAGWYLMKDISYVKYTGDDFTAYNKQGVTPMIAGDTSDDDELAIDFTEELTLHLDWTASQPTVSIIYAPDMQWSLAQDNTVSMEQKNPATTAITAPELWTVGTNGWFTNQARLRVYTGAEGDVVTLTSSAFESAWEVEPATYTATTDAKGNAYFYGATTGNAALTSNFIVQLTQMRVAVQQPSDSQGSEGRSVSLEGENTLVVDLDTPITLLEASDVVPVTLTATKAYRIEANVKREASAKSNLSVIDGSCGITERTDLGDLGSYFIGTAKDIPLVLKQIETAVAMGITEFTVINELAIYDQINMANPTCAATVVGEAIRQLVPEAVPSSTEAVDYNGSITLTLADATVVIDAAFLGCTALKRVSAPAATGIGMGAFIQCTGLEEVELDVATEIDPLAFNECTALQSVSAPAVTTIYNNAFNGCTALQTVTLGHVTNIASSAFSGTQVTNLNFDYLTILGASALSGLTFSNLEIAKEAASDAYITLQQKAFGGCRLTGSVKFHRVVGYGSQVDGLTKKNAFEGVTTSHLDLFLDADQPSDQISVSNGKLMWAGAEWKSITMGDRVYTQMNGFVKLEKASVTYAVLDGMYGNYTGTDGTEEQFNTYRDYLKAQIATAYYTVGITHFYVINELGTYTYKKEVEYPYGNRSYEFTFCVVGEAFTAFAKENAGARVSITLADATSVPEGAFQGCTALENIELDIVKSIGHSAFRGCTALKSITTAATTIEGSAFYDCTSLESATLSAVTEINGWVFYNCTSLKNLTFGAVITIVWNNMFDNVTDCDLTLASGQQHMNDDGPSTPNGIPVTSDERTWGGNTWKSITISNNQ